MTNFSRSILFLSRAMQFDTIPFIKFLHAIAIDSLGMPIAP
jgi:hypothetical protein